MHNRNITMRKKERRKTCNNNSQHFTKMNYIWHKIKDSGGSENTKQEK